MKLNVQKDYFKQKVMVIHLTNYQSTLINGKGLWSVRTLHNVFGELLQESRSSILHT